MLYVQKTATLPPHGKSQENFHFFCFFWEDLPLYCYDYKSTSAVLMNPKFGDIFANKGNSAT